MTTFGREFHTAIIGDEHGSLRNAKWPDFCRGYCRLLAFKGEFQEEENGQIRLYGNAKLKLLDLEI
jgi:hypothetical protein